VRCRWRHLRSPSIAASASCVAAVASDLRAVNGSWNNQRSNGNGDAPQLRGSTQAAAACPSTLSNVVLAVSIAPVPCSTAGSSVLFSRARTCASSISSRRLRAEGAQSAKKTNTHCGEQRPGAVSARRVPTLTVAAPLVPPPRPDRPPSRPRPPPPPRPSPPPLASPASGKTHQINRQGRSPRDRSRHFACSSTSTSCYGWRTGGGWWFQRHADGRRRMQEGRQRRRRFHEAERVGDRSVGGKQRSMRDVHSAQRAKQAHVRHHAVVYEQHAMAYLRTHLRVFMSRRWHTSLRQVPHERQGREAVRLRRLEDRVGLSFVAWSFACPL
jgi:hypothetical protein